MNDLVVRDRPINRVSSTASIENPILPGFHPDPSILRVDGDYYIATSTFEWFPGVALHHSKDLVHWRPIGHALTRISQLDMAGNPQSGGVWAPCLSHSDGTFYLVYTNTRAWGRGFMDTPNFLVTAPRIDGPWSDPIHLNSSGFDPSLFHDADGRKWLVNMLWDHRPSWTDGHKLTPKNFAGIVLQEYCPERRRLTGPVHRIFAGTSLGITEGPHLYRRGDYYYLLVAEGGTGFDHAVCVARSRNVTGPYEADPHNPILTSRGRPDLTLQKSGHASLVETQNGEVYLAHLCSRPSGSERRCMLGRETALQRARWTADGWLRLEGSDTAPRTSVPGPELAAHPFAALPSRDRFDAPTLGPQWQTLRIPADGWVSLDARPGYLRIVGRESPLSLHRHSFVARRVTSERAVFETSIDFTPDTFQQIAGLMVWYDHEHFYYLALCFDPELGRSLRILAADSGRPAEPAVARLAYSTTGRPLGLRGTLRDGRLRFAFCEDGRRWCDLDAALDATILSDDYGGLSFTGMFVGMAVHDLSGAGRHADFGYFEYREVDADEVTA